MIARQGLVLRLAPVAGLAALLALAAAQAASAPTPQEGFERGVGMIVLAGGAVAALAVPPAWTISGGLVLSMFSSHWHLLGSGIDVDRYVLFLGVLSVLAREWRRRDRRLETRPVDWLLIVVALYALTSAWVVGELDHRGSRFSLIDNLGLLPFAVFFVAPFAFRTERDRRVLLASLVGIGAYLGITAVLEKVGPDALIVPNYITDQSLGIHQGRARGPFLDAGAMGIAMYGCGVAAAIAFVKWRSPRWRAFALFVAGLCVLGIVLSLTRAVWLAAIVASPIALAAVREARRYLVPAAAVAFVLVTAALAAIPGLRAEVRERREDRAPVWDRQNSNAAAVRMIEDRPLWGFGWGRSQEDSVVYYRQAEDYPLTPARELHNRYLQTAVELGLVGALLWIVALLAAIGGAITRRGPPELRLWKVGLFAYAVSVLVAWATAPAEYMLPTLLLWLWAGVAWGAREDQSTSRYTTQTQPTS